MCKCTDCPARSLPHVKSGSSDTLRTSKHFETNHYGVVRRLARLVRFPCFPLLSVGVAAAAGCTKRILEAWLAGRRLPPSRSTGSKEMPDCRYIPAADHSQSQSACPCMCLRCERHGVRWHTHTLGFSVELMNDFSRPLDPP